MRFELLVLGGGDTGRALSVSRGQALTFGRLASCDVQVDDEMVSRRHCTVQVRDGVCVVADLQSANGTFVNDRRIDTAGLEPGDRLRMGSTVFELLSATAREDAVDAAPASFRVTGEERGETVVRRSIDPARPEFLTRSPGSDDQTVLESAQRYVATLHDVSELLSHATGVEALFDSILSAILDVTGGERAAILMRAPGASDPFDVHPVAVRTPLGAAGNMALSRTVVRDVLEHGISNFSHDALTDLRFSKGESIVRQRIRSVMCAPLRTSGEILGVLYVDSQSTHAFDEIELELLAAVGNQAGLAVHRARLVEEVERLFLDFTKAMAAIIDAKDGYTHRHSERVALVAVRLARQLGLASDRWSVVELAALLHDVGKIGVPDAILNKPEALTESEYAEVKLHPVHGAAILSNIQSRTVSDLLPGVQFHHERWDGSGYPQGLRGEEIPLLARIIAVADFFDAMTTDRTYRPASPLSDVIDLARRLTGQAFDPRVVEALVAGAAREWPAGRAC